MKKFIKRIASSLLVVCMLIMGSASVSADTADLWPGYGTTGKISCAYVDRSGNYDRNTATGRITFDQAPQRDVHYTLKMYYYDEEGNGDLILANQADFTYNTQVPLSIDMEARVPAGYSANGSWYFEATWDDDKYFVGMDNIFWYQDSSWDYNVLHDDGNAITNLFFKYDGQLQ